jgi:hypothetical protein
MKTRIVPSSELSPETLRAQDYVDNMEEHARKAQELIDAGDNLCYDVAVFHGQDFENVKHMTWFKYAVMSRMCGAD